MIQGRRTTLSYIALDILSVVLVFNFFTWIRIGSEHYEILLTPLLLPVAMQFLAVYLVDGYSTRTDMLSAAYMSMHTISLLFVLGLTLLLTFVFIPAGYTLQISRFITVASLLTMIPLTLGYRRLLYQRALAKKQQRYFMFLGSPESCLAFKEECRKTGMTQSVLYATHATFMPELDGDRKISNPPFGDVSYYLKEYQSSIDAIILRESSQELPLEVAQHLMELHFSGVPTYTLELFHEAYWRKIPLYRLNQTWLFQGGFQIAREPVFERLKRVSDVLISSLGLILLLPLLPFIALLIWLDDRGPIFFRQARVGKNRELFDILKLRTMRVDDGKGNAYTQVGDSRITRIGSFLRATRIDELPQLWNVFKGDMSLIGPRAEWARLVANYEKEIPCYHFRHLVKPGITGWAQINYPYGANLEDTKRKLEYDLYYIRYFSFTLDASIVLKTIHVMLFGQGR
jgi:exopolysaccharide biosynthesis polyprenyl glycosylphosphotransferase